MQVSSLMCALVAVGASLGLATPLNDNSAATQSCPSDTHTAVYVKPLKDVFIAPPPLHPTPQQQKAFLKRMARRNATVPSARLSDQTWIATKETT
ncbi:hypothetical protein PENARI_c018G09648 [Penicillium arizonense]|uniref:Uncharacterized protein n=1 Tax=Penicillium arizonense TaxID=1835702 RepID=A0A1F5LAH9_PENAI|nr:hypothetical protein PENARI_c018G09648 [Penicillium arizonense]OGE50214.1 hypothetical protein PENARI_c018G09648 [Penicillium arizonense]